MIEFPVQDVLVDINNNPLKFRDNTQWKKANRKLKLSAEHIEEFIKCQKDILYFGKKYYYIIDPDKGLSLIKFYNFQKRVLLDMVNNRHIVILSARQSSKSTLCTLVILWYSIFNKDKISAILANKEATAKEIFSRLITAYEYLPNYLKPGLFEISKTAIHFDNGCKIICAASSTSSIRGHSVNGILQIDECAFLGDSKGGGDDFFYEFFNSVYPTISKAKNSKVIMVSTPNGVNFFYQIWQNALKRKNDFYPIRIKWNEVPGRDNTFKEKMISTMGLKSWQQEFECDFLNSSNTLLSGECLKKFDFKIPVETKDGTNLKIYEKPNEKSLYLIGVDTSKGTGGDYSTIQVFDVSKYPFKQVAVYRNNQTAPMLFSEMVIFAGKTYNNAVLIIENNAEGKEVADTCWYTHEYTKMYNAEGGKDIGLRTTRKTKSIGIVTLKELLDNDKMIICDYDTINEFSHFIRLKNMTYGAEKGHNDDCITPLWLICYYLRTDEFRDMYQTMDMKKELYDEKLKQLQEEFCIPIIENVGNHTISTDNDVIPDALKNERIVFLQ